MKTTNNMKTINKVNKDYIGYSFWKTLRGNGIGIDINPIVNEVIKNYEKNKIPYLRSEIENKVWNKVDKHRYDVMEYIF